jgi:hypothetical protein
MIPEILAIRLWKSEGIPDREPMVLLDMHSSE